MTVPRQTAPPAPAGQSYSTYLNAASMAVTDSDLATSTLALMLAGTATPAALIVLLSTPYTGLWPQAVRATLTAPHIRELLSLPTVSQGGTGRKARSAQFRQNVARRALYLVSAIRRVSTAATDPRGGRFGVSAGPGDSQRLQLVREAVEREKGYLKQHLDAVAKRTDAAKAVDLAAATWGLLLGWHAVIDSRTSPDCRAAHRTNFEVGQMPKIGYPGTVHPSCRCRAGRPWGNAIRSLDNHLEVEEVAASRGPVIGQVVELVKSSVYPGLERKPGGPDNWVEKAGGLPSYIERIAKHLHYEQGMSISHAIASAVNTVKKWAAGGGNVTTATQAKAARAVAQWEAKKIKGRAK